MVGNQMADQFVKQALSSIRTSPHNFAILDLDVEFFCTQANQKNKIKDATECLIRVLCSKSEHLQDRIHAAVLCLDIFKSNLIPLSQDYFGDILDADFSQSKILSNFQSRLIAVLIECAVRSIQEDFFDSEDINVIFQALLDKVQDESNPEAIGLALDVLFHLFTSLEEKVEDQELTKKLFCKVVPMILPVILEAFTNEELQARDRSHILHLFYLMVRGIAWADGLDNSVIQSCLNETFNNWMALFLQIIQSNASKNFPVKINALRCLTVIFRDLINFSRNSINIILKPAWKLLNQTLPVYTELIGYKQVQNDSDDDEDTTNDPWEEDQDTQGVQSLTFHILELLASLVQRPNVQMIVQQGIVPLTTTVCSYLIVESSQEQAHRSDQTYFLTTGIENLSIDTIRNKCLQLINALIEVFGDETVGAMLLFIQNICIMSQGPHKKEDTQKQESKDVKQSLDQLSEHDQETKEFQQILQELVYMSTHPKHPWKRREVGMLLISVFAEDISMYILRSPLFSFMTLIENILNPDLSKVPKSLVSHLQGRHFASCLSIVDLVNVHDEKTIEFMRKIITATIEKLNQPNLPVSVKIAATRCLTKYLRKIPPQHVNVKELSSALNPLLQLIDLATIDCINLPVEAFTVLSKIDETSVSEIAGQVTPKMLQLFQNHHSDGNLGNELIQLFKIWCRYQQCQSIFVETFIPFIQNILEIYFNQTQGNNPQTSEFETQIVDSSILTHSLDLLCTILKSTKENEEKKKVVRIFPHLIEYLNQSDDMFLLLHGTTTMKTFIHSAASQIKEICGSDAIISVAKRLLDPKTNEQAGVCLGNLVIQIIDKIQPMIDTSLLMCVVQKIYKCRMPSIVQSLVLVFARLIQTNPKEIVTFLSETSIDNRISLKIVLDKWLLQQPLFRGTYTRTVTLISLMSLLLMRDPRIEILMVIGYNPSHSNVNSEVNAPFKILSSLLRFIENELKPTNKRPLRPVIDMEEVKESGATGAFAGYKVPRSEAQLKPKKVQTIQQNSGMRMDTLGGEESDENVKDRFQDDENDYVDQEDDYQNSDGGNNSNDVDRLSVNLDDLQDENDSDEAIDLTKNNREDSLSSLAYNPGSEGTQSTTPQKIGDLFTVKQANDKGLADMETGSEVYMSELLAGFDMEDMDDAEEANEEDLLELGDKFAQIKILVTHIQETMNQFITNQEDGLQYMRYCVQQLPSDDGEIANKYLKFLKDTQLVKQN